MDWDELEGFKLKGQRSRIARFFLGDDDPAQESLVAEPPQAAEDAADTEDEEPETLLLQVKNEHTGQIANPVARFLHKLAHGPGVPIYGGLENRQELIKKVLSYEF